MIINKTGRIRASFIAAILLFSVLAGLIGCSGTSVTPREGILKGKLINVSGKPIEDALVYWAYDSTRWCLTDENGEFTIEAIGFGDQQFYVEAFGYRTSMFSASIFSGQVTQGGTYTVEAKSFDYLEISASEVSATHAVIEWKTTEYTNGLVEYGETETLGRTVRETEKVYSTAHSLIIKDLSPEKKYFFRIVANREGREAEKSVLNNFTTQSTLEDKTPPSAPSGVAAALTSIPGQATVFWAPSADSDLKGYRVYRSELENAPFSLVSNMLIAKGQERYTDVTAVPGKKYYYRVTAIDQAGNESGFNNLASILVPGDIANEIRWTRANSPYLLNGDLNILPTGKLYIDSGVEILVADADAFRSGDENKVEITVSGAIIASAGNDIPIIFASARSTPEKSDWKGISFSNVENPANTLVNVVINDTETAITISSSQGIFNQISINNSIYGFKAENNTGLTFSELMIKRCTTAVEIKNNNTCILENSTFIHPSICVNSQSNDGLTIRGNNFLEFTESGLISNEAGGIITISNNLFVSPQGTALKILTQNPVVEYNTFDVAYGIQINQGNPVIQKNIMLSQKSLFGTGKKGIEYISNTLPVPVVGPNNIYGFTSEAAYINCTASADSRNEEILLMSQINGKTYDYRLRQPFPDLEDPWGIRREELPYE